MSNVGKLNKGYLVVKCNTLNEVHPNDMSLQELRFFSIYLSKINPKDINTRIVKFSLSDFYSIMGFSSKNLTYLKNIIDGLLMKIIGIPDEKGTGIIRFQLFKECIIFENENNEWFIEINAHDRALPLLFNLKSHYFKYELWNTLRLKSRNQLRMYEILKQYEKIGSRIILIKDLKNLLGIDEKDYPLFNDFKRKVLDVCQKSLTEHTDISYTYEPYGKKGRGGKVIELKFDIIKNKDFVSPLNLSKFIDLSTAIQDSDPYDDVPLPFRERINLFTDACCNEFTWEEMRIINDLMMERMSFIYSDQIKCYHYLSRKCQEMNYNDKRNGGIKNRFKYMCKLIGTD